MAKIAEEFDYIIVGAGTAGCVMARRLSEQGKFRVLLLEAGGPDSSPWIKMPIGYGKCFYDQKVNWKYFTEPVDTLEGRRLYWPRGRVMGGSSSINALVYVRGHPQDFDDWEAAGANGWSWADIESVFRRIEDWSGSETTGRGAGGPVPVQDVSGQIHPICRSYLEAAKQAGINLSEDYNGKNMEGAFAYQITTKSGVRASASKCYLKTVSRNNNLKVVTNALATRILFNGREATGVRYCVRNQDRHATARHEVIISGGAINSPQLLQLSGVGPVEVLKNSGIEVILESPHAGRNLQDHLCVDFCYRSRVETLNQKLRPWAGKIAVGLQYLVTRRGPLALSVNQCGGFVRSGRQSGPPTFQLYFSPASYSRAPVGKRPLMTPDRFPGFLFGFNPCRPTSRGRIQIRSPNPLDPPEIHPNYLATNQDLEEMIAGIRLIKRIANTRTFREMVAEEILPGYNLENKQDALRFIRTAATSVFHPCCTCRIGKDISDSVVDPRLRVHGIGRLRVADASVFPNITSGNTNAPTYAVGERAAEIILEDARK